MATFDGLQQANTIAIGEKDLDTFVRRRRVPISTGSGQLKRRTLESPSDVVLAAEASGKDTVPHSRHALKQAYHFFDPNTRTRRPTGRTSSDPESTKSPPLKSTRSPVKKTKHGKKMKKKKIAPRDPSEKIQHKRPRSSAIYKTEAPMFSIKEQSESINISSSSAFTDNTSLLVVSSNASTSADIPTNTSWNAPSIDSTRTSASNISNVPVSTTRYPTSSTSVLGADVAIFVSDTKDLPASKSSIFSGNFTRESTKAASNVRMTNLSALNGLADSETKDMAINNSSAAVLDTTGQTALLHGNATDGTANASISSNVSATNDASKNSSVPSNANGETMENRNTAEPKQTATARHQELYDNVFGGKTSMGTNSSAPVPPYSSKAVAPPKRAPSLAREEMYCVPWTQSADQWWQEKPEYEIGIENDTHYCFQRVQDPEKRQTFIDLYQTQFHGNCSNSFTKRMWSSGWGADFMNVIDGLRHAVVHNRPMQIANTPWHYADPHGAKPVVSAYAGIRPACKRGSMFCYFLPLSSCPATEELDKHAPLEKPLFDSKLYQWYYEYATRRQTWLRKLTYEFRTRLTIQTPCTAIHVRRGDIILDPGDVKRQYFPIKDYLNASFHVQRNIFLMTDDANAITEAKQEFPDYNWMYVQRTRFHAEEGGFENQMPSRDPIFEVIALLSEFQLARSCQQLVHSESIFGTRLFAEMKASGNYPEVSHIKIGDKENVYSAEHADTAHGSATDEGLGEAQRVQ